jgi:hypothetical protein
VPTIGTKSVPLVNGGALQQNVMAILMIGGPKANVKISKTALDSDRSKTGVGMAADLKSVPDLKVVMALSEGDLSFEQGVNVEGFLQGVLKTLGPGVSLWGGNGRRVQYYNDEVLSRHVVALGLGGPISVVYSTSTEFQPVGEPVEVTKVSDIDPKLVLELNGRPAPEVYRERRGMPATELFTRDSEHPVGVITGPGKAVYVRQVFAAYPLEKESIEKIRVNDPLTGKIPADTKGLRFIAPIPVGTKLYVLKGGGSAERIYESAAQCMQEMIKAIPPGKKPMVALLSDCVTRNSRIRRFTNDTGDEVFGGILPGMGGLQFPIMGFYAGGEIGHIIGEYQGLPYQYQQHSFVPILLVQ